MSGRGHCYVCGLLWAGCQCALAAAASGGDVKQAPAESPQSGDAKQRNAQPLSDRIEQLNQGGSK